MNTKCDQIRDTVEGPLSSFVPASALQLHERATIVIDEAAASLLKLKDYYQFVGELQDDLVQKYRPSEWISR